MTWINSCLTQMICKTAATEWQVLIKLEILKISSSLCMLRSEVGEHIWLCTGILLRFNDIWELFLPLSDRLVERERDCGNNMQCRSADGNQSGDHCVERCQHRMFSLPLLPPNTLNIMAVMVKCQNQLTCSGVPPLSTLTSPVIRMKGNVKQTNKTY